MIPKNTRRTYIFAHFLAVIACLTLASCGTIAGAGTGVKYPPSPNALTVSFIDVGQGDSILVQAGGEDYLVDAGRPEQGPNVVDFLRSRGVGDLEGIVSSNPDEDHIGGFDDVLAAFDVEALYISGDPKETMTYRTLLEDTEAEGINPTVLRTGHQLDWGGIPVDVIAPAPGELSGETNDNSLGLLIRYGLSRVLLTGDAEASGEEYMAGGAYTGPVTVMKINHHGSNTSTTPLFLGRFRPEVAVIQSGADNSYGHPTPETLERLQKAGVEVFRNDLHGDVIVEIQGDEMEVSVTKP